LVDIEQLAVAVRAFLPWVDPKPRANGVKECSSIMEKRTLDDSALIACTVSRGARVLDLGCGDGELLALLRESNAVTGVGVDIDIQNIIKVIDRGLEALHADIDGGLAMIADGAYQYAILSQTLPAVKEPRLVLREMVRVAKMGIVAFTNRGHWRCRLDLLWHGKMPKELRATDRWYDTMDIHPFTLGDFYELCREEQIEIVEVIAIADGALDRALTRMRFLNLGANRALVKVRAFRN